MFCGVFFPFMCKVHLRKSREVLVTVISCGSPRAHLNNFKCQFVDLLSLNSHKNLPKAVVCFIKSCGLLDCILYVLQNVKL